MDFGWFVIIFFVAVYLLSRRGNSDEIKTFQEKSAPRHSAPKTKKKPTAKKKLKPERSISPAPSTSIKSPPKGKTPRANVTYSHLAGFPHREFGKNKIPSSVLYVGQTLTARREKTNQHDSNAIRLYYREKWVGFIAKESNPPLAEHMDNGSQLRVEIIKINDADTWRGIHLAIEDDNATN